MVMTLYFQLFIHTQDVDKNDCLKPSKYDEGAVPLTGADGDDVGTIGEDCFKPSKYDDGIVPLTGADDDDVGTMSLG